jgi:ankyrin repeat protein
MKSFQDIYSQCVRKVHNLETKEKLKKIKNIDAVDKYGRTLLYCACSKGNIEIVDLLLSKNANMFIGFIKMEDDLCTYETPMRIACENGYLDVVKSLIKKNKNSVRIIYNPEVNVPEIVEKAKDKFFGTGDNDDNDYNDYNDYNNYNDNMVNNYAVYETPLRIACINNRFDIIKELVKNGANIFEKSRYLRIYASFEKISGSFFEYFFTDVSILSCYFGECPSNSTEIKKYIITYLMTLNNSKDMNNNSKDMNNNSKDMNNSKEPGLPYELCFMISEYTELDSKLTETIPITSELKYL